MNNGVTILVADDDQQVADTLTHVLKDAGYSTVTAADGDQAMALLLERDVSLVVLDLKMPSVGGLGVLKFIKQTRPKTKVIVLTAYADLRNGVECRQLGADDFISKPYEIEDVLRAIDRLLSH